jgi:hypothetical protein
VSCRSRVSLLSRLLIVGLALQLGACGDDGQPNAFVRAARAVGLADAPPPPAMTVDIVCDPTKNSTCTAESLDATVTSALGVLADRPGSELRIFVLGPDLASTRLVVTMRIEAMKHGNANAGRTAKAKFIDTSRAYSAKVMQPYLAAPDRGGSPLAEGLTSVAMTEARTKMRVICVISDGRQVSAIGGDFECDDPLAPPKAFVKALQRERVLPPKSLTGIRVFFTCMTVTPIEREGCAETLERLAVMQELWVEAIGAAGGDASFKTGTIDGPELLPGGTDKGGA